MIDYGNLCSTAKPGLLDFSGQSFTSSNQLPKILL
jgi:hypothetical protein